MVRSLGGLLSDWRGLARFWVAVLLALGLTAGVLQTLGPPRGAMPDLSAGSTRRPDVAGPVARTGATATARAPARDASGSHPGPLRPGRDTPGPVADADP